MALRLKDYITESGELKVELPEDHPVGEVEVIIEEQAETAWEDQPWTDDEIKEMMRSNPKTGAEIAESDAIGGWEHMGITDSVEWVAEQRRKGRENRAW